MHVIPDVRRIQNEVFSDAKSENKKLREPSNIQTYLAGPGGLTKNTYNINALKIDENRCKQTEIN